MTLALDHTQVTNFSPRLARLARASRARVAAFYRYWFVECVEPRDPFASLDSRERWDLPVWHPADPEA